MWYVCEYMNEEDTAVHKILIDGNQSEKALSDKFTSNLYCVAIIQFYFYWELPTLYSVPYPIYI